MLRECLIVRVTARWCFAQSPVYLRGRILPVSVTKRAQAWGSVKGISAGVGVCCFCSVVLMELKEGRSCCWRAGCQPAKAAGSVLIWFCETNFAFLTGPVLLRKHPNQWDRYYRTRTKKDNQVPHVVGKVTAQIDRLYRLKYDRPVYEHHPKAPNNDDRFLFLVHVLDFAAIANFTAVSAETTGGISVVS
jgi:hypothetical protein